MVLELVAATCDPSDTLAEGALIESAPAVKVNVAGVTAATGRAVTAAAVANALARRTNFDMSDLSDIELK